MEEDTRTGSMAAAMEGIARYNMLLTEAIFEVLAEKGVLSGLEVKERIEKLKRETHLQFRWLQ